MKRRFFLAAPAILAARPSFAAPSFGAPGPRNLITDVPGLNIGIADDPKNVTGVTVILPDTRAPAAVDVRGGGPATRETNSLNLSNLVRSVDAIVLSGGSVYGLGTADGVVSWLGARGRGYALAHKPGVPASPVVPAAALYDLASGGDKNWGEHPPYAELGMHAVSTASRDFALGTHGAGYGASSGALKGGLGSASYITHDGISVGAIVACNSLGSVVAPGGKRFWAGAFEIGQEFGGLGPPDTHATGEDWGRAKINPEPRTNTTIACIATDLTLTPSELGRIAIMAQDGLPRAVRPIHTPFDGDVVFALSTAKRPLTSSHDSMERELLIARIGALAADTLARAIARGVYAARTPPGMSVPAWVDL